VRTRLFGLALCGLLLVLVAISVTPVSTSSMAHLTTCSAAQKAKRVAALKKFRSRMLPARRHYFRTHHNRRQQARFVTRQNAKLRALRRAAACKIVRSPPPPPLDRTPPHLLRSEVAGATLRLVFDEQLAGPAAPASAFGVTVDGLAWNVAQVSLSSTTEALVLRPAVDAGQVVKLVYTRPTTGGLHDAAGNTTPAFTTQASNFSLPAPAPSPGAFSPALAKPSFADDHSVPGPWVGEWGPKTDPQWEPSTGHLRALLVPIDFPDVVANRSPAFYRDLFTSTTPPWYAESSYGRLSFDLTAIDHYVRMSNPIDSYDLQNCCPSDKIHAFFQELIAKLDPVVDFRTVDTIYAIAPEAAGPHMSILLWRRWPGSGIVADGHELLNGVVGNGNFRSLGTAHLLAHDAMTHETGHMMGLADLYGRACPTCTDTHDWVGVWSMMDTSNEPSAEFLGWDRWLLRWLDPTQIRGVSAPGQSTEEVVSPLEERGGVKLIVVPLSTTFLYAVEVRQPIGRDIRLCDHGVLVYTVDSTTKNGSGPTRIQAAHSDAPCGPISDAAFDLGPGEVPTFEDAHVKVELLAVYPDGSYRVRVTRK
jgi:M6 family metalloprotease-like protein